MSSFQEAEPNEFLPKQYKYNPLLVKSDVGHGKPVRTPWFSRPFQVLVFIINGLFLSYVFTCPVRTMSMEKLSRENTMGQKRVRNTDFYMSLSKLLTSILHVALQGWRQHIHTRRSQPDKDFLTLNRNAINAGAVSSHDVSEYQRSHDVRIKMGRLRLKRADCVETLQDRPAGAKSSTRSEWYDFNYRADVNFHYRLISGHEPRLIRSSPECISMNGSPSEGFSPRIRKRRFLFRQRKKGRKRRMAFQQRSHRGLERRLPPSGKKSSTKQRKGSL